MVEHLDAGNAARAEAAGVDRMEGIAPEVHQTAVDHPAADAAASGADQTRRVDELLGTGSPSDVVRHLRCPHDIGRPAEPDRGGGRSHRPEEFTSRGFHPRTPPLPMTGVAVQRRTLLPVTIHAEIHVDLDQGTLGWALRLGDSPMAGFAAKSRDRDVTAVRVEHVVGHPEQLVELQGITGCDQLGDTRGLGRRALRAGVTR